MNEEAKVEREASAPLLVQIIEENNIKGVLLDLDNTLLYTNQYYYLVQNSLSMELAEMFKSSIPNSLFTERMEYNLNLVYGEGTSILLIEEKYLMALDMYFKDNRPSNYSQYVSYVKSYLQDFYDVCPELIEGSVEMLSLLKKRGICFALNSHAQDKWTKPKALKFAEELNMHAIPYNSIDLSRSKDAGSWCKSARYIGKDIGETLVVGDSLTADILPAIEAGCKNLVWIKGNLEKLPLEIRDDPDIHIWCVDSVKDLMI